MFDKLQSASCKQRQGKVKMEWNWSRTVIYL